MSIINVEIYSIIILLILIFDYVVKFWKKFNTASIIWLVLAVSTLIISVSNIVLTYSASYTIKSLAMSFYLLSTLVCSLFVYIYVKFVYISYQINIKKELWYVMASILVCAIIALSYVVSSSTYVIHSFDRSFFNKLLTIAIIPNLVICIHYIYNMLKRHKIINYKIVFTLLLTAIALLFDIINESLFFVSGTFTLTALIVYINKHESLLNTDPLTGLSNKRVLETFIENIKPNLNIAVYNMDINKFKSINDKYGHLKGDLVLKKVSEVLRNSARDRDLVIRNGGDEFLIIAVIRKEEDATVLLERIKNNLAQYSKSSAVKVTVSVGWGVYKSKADTTIHDFDKFMKKIDKKMYLEKEIAHAKIGGKRGI